VLLLYHRVLDSAPASDPFTVSREAFERQVVWLAERFTLRTAAQVVAATARERLEGSAAITFDDGDPSVVEVVLPVLMRHGVPATVFVDVGRLTGRGGPGLSPADLRALDAAGIEVASHGVSHTDLTALTDDEVRDELERSRELLQTTIEKPVTGFAYPFGAYDERVASLTRRAGYAYACTCRQHRPVLRGDDVFQLCRLEITPYDDELRFPAKLQGAYAHVFAAWYRLNPSMRAWLD